MVPDNNWRAIEEKKRGGHVIIPLGSHALPWLNGYADQFYFLKESFMYLSEEVIFFFSNFDNNSQWEKSVGKNWYDSAMKRIL